MSLILEMKSSEGQDNSCYERRCFQTRNTVRCCRQLLLWWSRWITWLVGGTEAEKLFSHWTASTLWLSLWVDGTQMDEAGPDGWEVHRGKGSCKINKVLVIAAHLYIFILYRSRPHSPYFSLFFLFPKPRPFRAIGLLHLFFPLLACSLRALFLFIFQVLPPQRSLFWSLCLKLTPANYFFFTSLH